jgi:hypothetical protein
MKMFWQASYPSKKQKHEFIVDAKLYNFSDKNEILVTFITARAHKHRSEKIKKYLLKLSVLKIKKLKWQASDL